MAIEIRPCPFCGANEARLDHISQNYTIINPRSPEGDLTVNMDGFGWYWVCCGNCYATGPKYHGETYKTGNTGPKSLGRDKAKTAKAIETAVDSWNARTLWGV